jgi:hypothetical protein
LSENAIGWTGGGPYPLLPFSRIKEKKIAVGGDLRELVLTFKLEDQISEPNVRANYTFIHSTPKDVKVKINNKTYTWSQFIEKEEQNQQRTKRFGYEFSRFVHTM